MRALVVLLFAQGCIAVPGPEAPEDAALRDAEASVLDAGWDAGPFDARTEGGLRDAGMDARMPLDATFDAARDAAMDADREDAAAPASALVIEELRTRGPSGANDELVEIMNVGRTPLDVGGFKLRAESASGSVGTRAVIPTGIVLAPGESLLFANGGASGYSGSVPADVTYTFGLSDECGVAIVDVAGATLDAVGTLSAGALREGASLAPLTENADRSHVRRRHADTVVDTGDNAADFETLTPSAPRGRNVSPPTSP